MTEVNAQFDPMARRSLAAIVFTDIADSSRLMGENEEHTLKLVHRDMGIIGELCKKHSGRVLKSTGDGLLMYFASAVQAVSCALEIQSALAEKAKALPPGDVLLHRIGIHLGDVFVSDTDVMGDGVNIAARLQSEAEPGGICISETVYDVVKNRLALKATYLGPRELKNIKEAVPVYQILLDAAQAQGKPRPAAKPKPSGHHVKPWLWAMTGLLVVLCLTTAAVVYYLYSGRDKTVIATAAASASSHPNASNGSAQAAADPALAKINAAKPGYIPSYNFSGMMHWMENNGLKQHPAYERYAKLADLKMKTVAFLMQTDAGNPLVLDSPQGPQTIWAGSSGMLILKDAAGQREVRLEELPPPLFQSVVAAVVRGNPGLSRNTKLREAQQILAEELATVR